MGYPDDGNIGDSGGRLCALKGPVVFSAIED